MITLKEKKDCCGCQACVQRCPQHCIRMVEDSEGFLYPEVEPSHCIDCGLCEKVCPVINPGSTRKPLGVYAAINRDEEIRYQSSSGGLFTLLAEKVIEKNGVVFGAAFNQSWEVEHQYTETKEGIAAFRGSKYVQSRIGDTFKQVHAFLKEGRDVLFSGTPCQIRALKLYLRNEYDNLYTVDIVCHGVPSPGVFRTYLEEETEGNLDRIEFISFRDKEKGWHNYSFKFVTACESETGNKSAVSSIRTAQAHPFLRGFSSDLYLRPSCHSCPVKGLRSGSDLTLGDYWGIERTMPTMNDDKGISAVLVNSDKGYSVLDGLSADFYETSYADICTKNSSIISPTPIPRKRQEFFASTDESFSEKIQRLCHLTLWEKFCRKIKAVKTKLIRLITR